MRKEGKRCVAVSLIESIFPNVFEYTKTKLIYNIWLDAGDFFFLQPKSTGLKLQIRKNFVNQVKIGFPGSD